MGIRKGWRYYQCKKLITSAKIWGLIGCAEILLEVWEPSYVHYIAYIGPFLLKRVSTERNNGKDSNKIKSSYDNN